MPGRWESFRNRFPVPSAGGEGKSAGFGATAAGYSYIGYGDSITYGHGNGSDASNWYGLLLKNMLQNSHPSNDYTLYNEGYPVSKTSDLLNGPGYPSYPCPGINTILNNHPDAAKILIMGGTTDVNYSVPPSETKYNLGQLIDRARGNGVEPIISTLIPNASHLARWSRDLGTGPQLHRSARPGKILRARRSLGDLYLLL